MTTKSVTTVALAPATADGAPATGQSVATGTSAPPAAAPAGGTPGATPAAPAAPAPAAPAAPPPGAATPQADGGQAKTEGAAGPGTESGTPPAPAEYVFDIPPDDQVFDTPELRAVVTALARELHWTQEQANEEYGARLALVARGVARQREEWAAQITADPDYGGDNLTATQAHSRRTLDVIRPPTHPRYQAFMRLLDGPEGWGNHPEVVAFLADVGKHFGQDRPRLQGVRFREPGNGQGRKSNNEVFYGTEDGSSPKAPQ